KAGMTRTVAAGGGSTVTVTCPDTPSMVAFTCDVPGLTAVASPCPFTVMTALLPVVQATVRPVRTVPSAARAVAVNCCVAPGTSRPPVGVTVTVATGTGGGGGVVTETEAVPLTPSDVAVTVALPGASAAALPCASMRSTLTSLELQVTGRPVSGEPSAAV